MPSPSLADLAIVSTDLSSYSSGHFTPHLGRVVTNEFDTHPRRRLREQPFVFRTFRAVAVSQQSQ